jgi:hypothetical protein
MTQSTRPVFWAGLVGLPLVAITACAYYYWYQILVARGYGYIQNMIFLDAPFRRVRLCLAIALPIGLLTFQLTRRYLTLPWRIGYTVVIALAIAFFVVGWIIRAFGTTPFWHES